jgi:hypothetical protein
LQHDHQSTLSTIKPAYSSVPYLTMNHYTSEPLDNDPICTVPTPGNKDIRVSVQVILCIFLPISLNLETRSRSEDGERIRHTCEKLYTL